MNKQMGIKKLRNLGSKGADRNSSFGELPLDGSIITLWGSTHGRESDSPGWVTCHMAGIAIGCSIRII